MSEEYSKHLKKMADMLRDVGADPARAGELDAAVDILTDDGLPVDRAVELMFAALESGDPLEPQARHIVKLRKTLRGDTDG